MLKVVNNKTGSDGKSIDRSCKNVCLTDVEVNFLLHLIQLFDLRLLENHEKRFPKTDFSLEHELQGALDHSDTQFE